ncbi:MAG: stage II sporulation protein P [Halanaerobiales bacterium]
MKKLMKLIYILVLLLIVNNIVFADDFIGHIEENAVSVYDNQGNYIFGTAMFVTRGDRYIDEDNTEYTIEAVNGNRAIARKTDQIDLLDGLSMEERLLTPLAAKGSKLVGIYHTHNGESYIPGAESAEGKGEIHQVGEIFKNSLEKKGIRVIQSNNLHLPHDGAAYERSRATATDLARQRPDAIFDVHRDGIPDKNEYLKEIDGKLMSQVRLVVGRQNPNGKVNDKFARGLKAIADKQHPGLIRGIFYGSGNYNQQISPHSLLLEFGTHVTTKEQAAASAELLSDTINSLLYGGEGTTVRKSESPSAISTIFWIVGILISGILIYLLINEGSINGVIKRIKQFFGREIVDRGDS